MPDYRGGPRQQSGYGQELVKAIREGRTERQRSRNFDQKLAFTLGQAAITGVGGALSGADSYAENEKRKSARRDQATHDFTDQVADRYRARMTKEDALRESSRQYEAPEYEGKEAELPAWLTGGGTDMSLPSEHEAPTEYKLDEQGHAVGPRRTHEPDVVSSADAALSRMEVNSSRELAPMGGYYTPAARENEDAQAGALVRDMGTAESGMRHAATPLGRGMMGQGESGMYRSLPGRRR